MWISMLGFAHLLCYAHRINSLLQITATFHYCTNEELISSHLEHLFKLFVALVYS